MFSDSEAMFVEPGALKDLVGALRHLVANPQELQTRSVALRQRSGDFDAENVFGRFMTVCATIALSRNNQRNTQAN